MKQIHSLLLAGLGYFSQVSTSYGQATCTGSFSAISAATFVQNMAPGWNLGNSLDAFPNEDSWNNPAVVDTTFDDVKAAGFKSVRLPVTWAYHFIGSSNQGYSPDWTVDASWLQRVSDVIDMVTSRGLYTIVNVHHDSLLWADVTVSGANITMIQEKFYRLWYQIGTKLACKASLVAFEAINEPPGTTDAHATELANLNGIFLKAINDAGGFNSQRVVTLCAPGDAILTTFQWFQKPSSTYTNPYALQVHYYLPYAYTSDAWGTTIWGSDEDKTYMEGLFSGLKTNFSGIPVVIGEWLVSPVFSEAAARWSYYDYLSKMAAKYGMAPVVWDTGNDLLDRGAHTWRDPTGLSIHMNAMNGVNNSLPASTIDLSATSQDSSAYVFHKISDTVVDQSVVFLLNGNSIVSVADESRTLVANVDYWDGGNQIEFFSSYLSTYFSSSAAAGIKETITVSFSGGVSIPVQLILWDVPTLPVSSSTAVSGADLVVAVDWNSIGKPAAVAVYKADGDILFNGWTIYSAPLQQGESTFGAHWNWAWGQAGLTLTANAVNAVIASGESATFIIQSWPRGPGNSVNYTLNI